MDSSFSAYVSEWRTQKGRGRTENRDAGGIHVGSKQTVAVIVDAVEKGARGVDYAIGWVRQLLEIAQSNEHLLPKDFISAMRRCHGNQRSAGFLEEIAAYAVLVVDSEKRSSWTLNCGDCRVGGLTKHGEVLWLTPVHTGANPFGEDFTVDHANMSSRHFLTRRLRTQRFDEPALTMLDGSQFRSWLLATDGYWIESLVGLSRGAKFEDDASMLKFTLPIQEIKPVTDCSNFISTTVK